MTHTLHREGIQENDAGDYAIIVMVEENEPQKLDKLAAAFRIVLKYRPINYTGKALFPNLSESQLCQLCRRNRMGMAVFDNQEILLKLLKEIKDFDLGVSVVVSGLFSHIRENCCKHLGLPMHTVNYSLGVGGKKTNLPPPKITEITTMCGHGLVSFNLVQSLLKDVRQGQKNIEEASEILTRPCVCGAMNTKRAQELLKKMI
jgi:hypothetical protein